MDELKQLEKEFNKLSSKLEENQSKRNLSIEEWKEAKKQLLTVALKLKKLNPSLWRDEDNELDEDFLSEDSEFMENW